MYISIYLMCNHQDQLKKKSIHLTNNLYSTLGCETETGQLTKLVLLVLFCFKQPSGPFIIVCDCISNILDYNVDSTLYLPKERIR